MRDARFLGSADQCLSVKANSYQYRSAAMFFRQEGFAIQYTRVEIPASVFRTPVQTAHNTENEFAHGVQK